MDRQQKLQQARSQIEDIAKRLSPLAEQRAGETVNNGPTSSLVGQSNLPSSQSGVQNFAKVKPTISVNDLKQDFAVVSPIQPRRQPTAQELISSAFNLPEQTERLNTIRDDRDDAQDRIQDLLDDLSGQSKFQSRQEEEVGLSEKEQQVQDLTAQQNLLIAQSQTIPLEIQEEFRGAGATRGGVEAIETSEVNKNAIKALTNGALLAGAQGNLLLAQDQVQRAVSAKYDPIKDQMNAQLATYDLLSDQFTEAESKVAEANKAKLQADLLEIEGRAQAEEDILNLSITAQQNGADLGTIQAIQNSETFEEALQNTGKFLQDPKIELQRQQLLESIKTSQFNRSLSSKKFNFDLNEAKLQKERAEILAARDKRDQQTQAVIEADNAAALTKGRLDLVIDIMNDKDGLDKAVGTTVFNRSQLNVSGERKEFERKVKQLTSSLTLENTKYLKGAMSDKDLQILADAAVAFGPNEDGTLDVSPGFFMEQLGLVAKTMTGSLASAYIDTVPVEDAELIIGEFNN